MELILITNNLPNGSGFAVRISDGAAIFLPPHVGPTCDEHQNKEYLANLSENNHERASQTPYRATFVDWEGRVGRLAPEEELATPAPLLRPSAPRPTRPPSEMTTEERDEAIARVLRDSPRAMTTAEVVATMLPEGASAVNEEVALTHQSLRRLHGEGRAPAAPVRSDAKQDRASFWLWASRVEKFRR